MCFFKITNTIITNSTIIVSTISTYITEAGDYNIVCRCFASS